MPNTPNKMTKLVLSTSNVMNGGPSIVRKPTAEKSNTELTTSLRTNFIASQQALSSHGNGSTPNGTSKEVSIHSHPPLSAWTTLAEDTLFVPSLDFSMSGLAEERSQYDITVKLFYLPNIPVIHRCSQTEEAIELVLKELHVSSIDLMIISFPNIAFDADDEEDVDDMSDDDVTQAQELEEIEAMSETWRKLESLHEKGIINQLGLSEFGSQRLAKFLPRTRVKPSVDQINVRDCCVVPKPLILFAKQQGIELLTHNDCTNILPRGTVRELLGSQKGAGVLADTDGDGDGLRGEIEPQWVVKYTAVVKDRGVVENKGYFAVAELKT